MHDTATELIERAQRARREDRLAEARRDLVEAVSVARGGEPRATLARALEALGQIERDLGRGESALPLYEEAVGIRRDEGDALALAHSIRHLGDLHRDDGRLEEAERWYYEALGLYRGHGDPPRLDLANAIRPLALIKDAKGEVDEARRLWEEAMTLYASVDVREGVAECTARLARTILLALLAWSSAGAAEPVERDLAYGPDPQQRLDLAVPQAKGFPTVIFVHGGSLRSGDKQDDDYRNACAPFPPAGIACANVNYRLAPAHSWPAPAEDVAAAVAWVRAQIASRGGDPKKLVLMGHSSGAMLAAVVGSDARYLAQHGLDTGALAGVVPMGSIMWDVELEQALPHYGREKVAAAFATDSDSAIFGGLDAYLDHWPIHHVRSGLPDFLFLIAEAEQEHPPVLMTNKKFVEDARAKGNRADYKVLPGRTHYSALRKFNEPGDPVFALVRDFVAGLNAR